MVGRRLDRGAILALKIFLGCFRPNHLVRWFFGENALLGRFMIV